MEGGAKYWLVSLPTTFAVCLFVCYMYGCKQHLANLA